MTRLLAIALLLLTACDQPGERIDATDQQLPIAAGETPTHGYWALTRWPTLVLSEAGTCPVEAVEAALKPFHAAGIAIAYVAGECRPDAFHVEDGRLCLRTEGTRGGNTWWRYKPGTTDEISVGGITVGSDCDTVTLAHEVGHALGLGHNEDPTHPMYPAVTGEQSLDFGTDLAVVVARHQAYLER